MTSDSANDTPPILQGGKLKWGIYKMQNVFTRTYLDIEERSRTLCTRPAQNLEEGNGIWEIKPLGPGYSIRRVEPGKPDQFCTMTLDGSYKYFLSVAAYPVAWRLEIVNDLKHRGFEYIRFCWENTLLCMDIRGASKDNGAPVVLWTPESGRESQTMLMWKLIPVETKEGRSHPFYEGEAAGQSSTRTQRADCECGDLSIVTEVTTVTTRRRYRVEGA